VGSVDSTGICMPLSSGGPAYDGRIKPELMAYGEDGSSGAAALVSGAAVLVQDAYREWHQSIPEATLVRAALLNSADDIGTVHPDYRTGFGNLNAFRAVQTIVQGHFTSGTVAQNEVKTYPLSIPAGLSEVKILITWNDPAAQAGAAKSLVNDLDLQLEFPFSGQTWDPWVLDPSANVAALQTIAQRKKDTLNNVEQVTLEFPVAGNYMIHVKGNKVVTAGQKFYLVYQLDTADQFQFTYPSLADHLMAGNTHWIRWETSRTGAAVLEYATDGNNWRTAGTTTDLSLRYLTWEVPDTVTKAVLRMRTNSGIIALSDSFTISPQPVLSVGFNCADSFLIHWNKLPVAAYRVYELGAQVLEPFITTSDTAIILDRHQHPSLYYAVSPLMDDREGIRSNTLNYTSQGTGCYLKSFFLQTQTDAAAFFKAELGTTYGVAAISIENLVNGYYQPLRTIDQPTALDFVFADSILNQGENHYRLAIRLFNGTVVYSNVEVVYFLPGAPVLLYPNPLSQGSMLHVLIKESGRFSLQLTDMSGRQLIRQDLNNTNSDINTGFLARGIYIARIFDSKGKAFSVKVIVR